MDEHRHTVTCNCILLLVYRCTIRDFLYGTSWQFPKSLPPASGLLLQQETIASKSEQDMLLYGKLGLALFLYRQEEWLCCTAPRSRRTLVTGNGPGFANMLPEFHQCRVPDPATRIRHQRVRPCQELLAGICSVNPLAKIKQPCQHAGDIGINGCLATAPAV
jgi:hypothetical protein